LLEVLDVVGLLLLALALLLMALPAGSWNLEPEL